MITYYYEITYSGGRFMYGLVDGSTETDAANKVFSWMRLATAFPQFPKYEPMGLRLEKI